MDTFLQQLVNGLTAGSVYAVVALGYTMVYGIIQLINFAHGEVVMIGAMVAFSVITSLAAAGMPPLVVVMLGVSCAVPFSRQRPAGRCCGKPLTAKPPDNLV